MLKPKWFRFSLRSLVLLTLLAGSGVGLWLRWGPAWVLEQDFPISSLVGARFSPDGRLSLTVANDCRVWDTQTGALEHVLRKPDWDFIYRNGQGGRPCDWCTAFSPDSKYLALHVSPETQIFDLETGKAISTLKYVSSGRIVTRLICTRRDVDLTKSVYENVTEEEPVPTTFEMIFSTDSQRLLSYDSDGTLRLWDCRTGRELSHVQLYDDYADQFLKLGDLPRQEIACFEWFSRAANGFVVCSRHQLGGPRGDELRVWRYPNIKDYRRIVLPRSERVQAWSPDKSHVLTLDESKAALVLRETQTWQVVTTWPSAQKGYALTAPTFAPNGRTIAAEGWSSSPENSAIFLLYLARGKFRLFPLAEKLVIQPRAV